MADGYAIRMDGRYFSAAEERRLAAVMTAPNGALTGRSGVRAGAAPALSIGSSPESYVIPAHGGVITDNGGGGTYIYVIPSPVTITVPTRPATGQSRIDEIVVKILNSDERATDGAKEVDVAVITGTATSGTPTAPTVPTGQLRLREAAVPASGTIALSALPPRTVALGGVLPLADATDEGALGSTRYAGLVTYREDTQEFKGRFASAWKRFLTTDDVTFDSGWVDIPLASGFTAITATPQVRRIGKQILFQGGISATGNYTPNANHTVSVGGIPASMVPNRSQNDTFSPLVAASGATGYRAVVTTGGDLLIVAGPTASATVYLAGLTGYTID